MSRCTLRAEIIGLKTAGGEYNTVVDGKVNEDADCWDKGRGVLTVVKDKSTDPSGCCRKFFMVLTCWKWQDMSVASTISTTRARSSLDETK